MRKLNYFCILQDLQILLHLFFSYTDYIKYNNYNFKTGALTIYYVQFSYVLFLNQGESSTN